MPSRITCDLKIIWFAVVILIDGSKDSQKFRSADLCNLSLEIMIKWTQSLDNL